MVCGAVRGCCEGDDMMLLVAWKVGPGRKPVHLTGARVKWKKMTLQRSFSTNSRKPPAISFTNVFTTHDSPPPWKTWMELEELSMSCVWKCEKMSLFFQYTISHSNLSVSPRTFQWNHPSPHGKDVCQAIKEYLVMLGWETVCAKVPSPSYVFRNRVPPKS